VSIDYTAANVAPHTQVVRATYTVPTGKKAFCSRAYSELIRSAAATTLGKAAVLLVTSTTLIIVNKHYDNTVGRREWAALSMGGIFLAGDVVTVQTYDLSTGGTMDYIGIIGLMEFSA